MRRRCSSVLWCFALLALLAGGALANEPRARGIAVAESRVALVIGNAAYKHDALDNPVNDARLMAGALKAQGFDVVLQENLDRPRLVDALTRFGDRLNQNTIAVLYYAGHGLQLREHNFLIPIDAEIRNEEEIPIAGVDLGFILARMSQARSRINIVILDACRNNPFAGRPGVAAPQGLAQMDAPVGTLLAFATGPGKVAADSGGGTHSVYAANIAKFMPTPGLPVELMFKRVREAVVRETHELQVPWESSSLQGEFSFAPGVAAPPPAAEGDIAELAFWKSIDGSTHAGEYRAYLRQYPHGRFAELAQARIAAIGEGATSAARPSSATPAGAGRPDLLPRPGDSWRYRVQDQFRLGDLFITARVDEVGAQGISETWTTTSDAKLRTTLVPLEPGFHVLPSWTLTPPEFAPYLLASGALEAGQKLAEQQRRIEQFEVPMKVSVEGDEDVVVAAGRFRATRLVLRGQARNATRGGGAVNAEQVVWYAPAVKRIVKATVATRVGTTLSESTTFELVEYNVH
jgi:hypothetical protein